MHAPYGSLVSPLVSACIERCIQLLDGCVGVLRFAVGACCSRICAACSIDCLFCSTTEAVTGSARPFFSSILFAAAATLHCSHHSSDCCHLFCRLKLLAVLQPAHAPGRCPPICQAAGGRFFMQSIHCDASGGSCSLSLHGRPFYKLQNSSRHTELAGRLLWCWGKALLIGDLSACFDQVHTCKRCMKPSACSA